MQEKKKREELFQTITDIRFANDSFLFRKLQISSLFANHRFRHQITEGRELGNGVLPALNAIICRQCFRSQNFQTLAILLCLIADDSHKVLTFTYTAIKLLVKAKDR